MVQLKSGSARCGGQAIGARIESGSEQDELRGGFQSRCGLIIDPLGAGDTRRSCAWSSSIEQHLRESEPGVKPGNPIEPPPPTAKEKGRVGVDEEARIGRPRRFEGTEHLS